MQQRPYDRAKVGRVIGWGGEHLVCSYEGNRVIKFSWHVFFSRRWGVKKLLKDYRIGETYFAPYLLPTDIRVWNNSNSAVEFQPKVNCRTFTKNDLLNERIMSQIKDIFSCHTRMQQEIHKSFDIFGLKGLIGRLPHHELSNIMVTDDDKLIILDFTTIDVKPQWFEWPLLLFLRWAQRRQEFLLKKYWSEI